jgi:dUTP pyrophosphatase
MGNKEKNFNEMDLNQLTDLNIDNLNISELESLLGQFESMVTDSFNETINESLNNKNDLKFVTKFVNKSNNPDPEYAKEGDSGFDLRAFINEPITLKPLERKLIPTGLSVELPPNTELQVRPRSGMALKYGISVLNTPGTVDESYRGDIGIIAINLSNEDYTIQPGERIAQGVIMNVIGQRISELEKVEILSETVRGTTGFGSSGKN